MFVELHMIQNFAPSNLNRDDTNNPKDCEFGGVRRARISSQCLKRAIRSAPVFTEVTQVDNGTRSRWIARQVRQALIQLGRSEEDATRLANEYALQFAGKGDKTDGDGANATSVLVYYTPEEIRLVAAALHAAGQVTPASVKDLNKKMKDHTSAPDLALFGRMLANDPTINLDSACQVAHAISTHRATMEIDFFTAVDDLQPKEETGAGMMGAVGYNSATFYRYSRLDWKLLVQNLDGDVSLARRTVEAFLRASIAAVPTGKQNTFAAHNPPSFLLAVVREDGQGWSLANAFEKPITAGRDAGLVSRSVSALDDYWGRLARVYGAKGATPVAVAVDPDTHLEVLQGNQANTVEDWVAAVMNALPKA